MNENLVRAGAKGGTPGLEQGLLRLVEVLGAACCQLCSAKGKLTPQAVDQHEEVHVGRVHC